MHLAWRWLCHAFSLEKGHGRLDLNAGSDRTRRIRDAVEAALSDIVLLVTELQVRLAERAARELVAGRPVHTHELMISLRDFIRQALDLDPIPADVSIPMQGPARPSSSGSGNKDKGNSKEGGRSGGGSGGMEMGGTGGGSLHGLSADDDTHGTGHHS